MPTRHNICLLNDAFPPTIDGVSNAVVNYATEIEARYGHAAVVTPAHPEADDSAFPFSVLRYPSIDMRRLVGYMAGVPFSPELAGRIRAEGAELMHCHCPMASAMLCRSLRDALDVPVVFTYHTKYDIDIAKVIRDKHIQAGAIRALVQNISACDEVWVVSRGAGENLRSLGYEGDYTVMENGVDMPRERVSDAAAAAACAGYDLPAGVPVFLFVGRLMWYKGLGIILDALASLMARGVDFRMVFIGDGTDGQEVRRRAAELGLGGRCFFTGAIRDRDDIRAWYCRADLFLFPSTFDTNGLVVREAAACSLGSVLVAGSCAAEGVTDGRNGFLIEENAASMAACLAALCRSPERMRSVGEAAAAELYISWAEAVARAYDRYEDIIQHYRAGGYPRREKLTDSFFTAQGALMQALDHVETLGDELEQRFMDSPFIRLGERLRKEIYEHTVDR